MTNCKGFWAHTYILYVQEMKHSTDISKVSPLPHAPKHTKLATEENIKSQAEGAAHNGSERIESSRTLRGDSF